VTTAAGATVPGTAALAPPREAVVVTGADAAAALRAIGARNVRSTSYTPVAIASVTQSQAAALTARGLRVVPDAPVTLDADGTTPETTDATADESAATASGENSDGETPAVTTVASASGADPVVSTATTRAASSSRGVSQVGNYGGQAGQNVPGAQRRRDDRTADRRLSSRDLVTGSYWHGSGAGVTVAVVDSGVDEVPGLSGRVTRVANFTDESANDRYGHGTFDAGLIAGDGSAADGSATGIVGVAPKARILSVKVADSRGRSTVGQVALGLAWVIAHREQYGIDVINLSMSTAIPMAYDVNPLNALAEAAWFSGIAVVVSSGNGGRSTISSAPANDPFVMTVGSVYDHNTLTRADDTISPYTNIGRTLDGFVKPELMAPGQHMQSTLPTGSQLASQQTVTGLPSGYGQLSGTSMATAVASGIVVLLIEARPRLNTDQLKGALISATGNLNQPVLSRAMRHSSRFAANVGIRPSMALAAAYAQLFEHTTDYSSVDWNAVDWRAVAWDQATWTNVDWTSATWSSATWSEATWGSATWASLTWASATWADASWSSASWSSASWADASWSSASWSSASWADASWADATPAGD
jgi:serine protease AprX